MRKSAGTTPSITPLLKLLNAIKRQADQTVNEYHQVGRACIGPLAGSSMAAPSAICPIDTAGEYTFQVTFSNIFLERPTPSFGLELDPGSDVVPGHFPTMTAHIQSWQMDSSGDWGEQPGKPYGTYLGATVGVSITGQVGQTYWVHYHFVGRAQADSGPAYTGATNQLAAGTSAAYPTSSSSTVTD